MLILISDIHFVDESAGKHNIATSAFEGVFRDIQQYVFAKMKRKGKEPPEMRIVFLGDVFDLNRSSYWLTVNEDERPWDMTKNRDKIETHANKIMDDIIDRNRQTFDLFKGSMKERFGYPVEPERFYIPGNHDRLCNVFSSLRRKVRENLAIPDSTEPFPHVYDDAKYGGKYRVFARHGHEYDTWNYEGTDSYTDADYEQTPIGDLITTEIAARLPYAIMQHVGDALSPEEKETLRRNLEDIDNVRPYSALFDWIFYQVQLNPKITAEMNEAIKEAVTNFENLAYLQRWHQRHDKWNLFTVDDADKVQAMLRLFKFFNIDSAEGLMKIFSRVFGSPDAMPLDNSDKALIDKAKDYLTHTSDYRYMAMGHTHNPMQVPIRITSAGDEQFYLNTGTWRKRYKQGLAGGFMAYKNLTYSIFYSKSENESQLFETWTGALKEM